MVNQLGSNPVKRSALASATMVVVAALSPHVPAQPYPSRPVRIIVPFAPGGGSHIMARVIATRLTAPLGQQVLVDNLLHMPDEVMTKEGKPYTIYSHFFKTAKTIPVRKVIKNDLSNYCKDEIKDCVSVEIIKNVNEKNIKGGRKNGLNILKNIHVFKDYHITRNYPALDKTTKLSTHSRFGQFLYVKSITQ